MEILFRGLSNMLRGAWENLGENRGWALLLAIGAAIIAIALTILSRTRWGQSKPFAKCVVLSILAHVWLLMYAYGTRLQGPGSPFGSPDAPIRVALSNDWDSSSFSEAFSESEQQALRDLIESPDSDGSQLPSDELPMPELREGEAPGIDESLRDLAQEMSPPASPSEFLDLPLPELDPLPSPPVSMLTGDAGPETPAPNPFNENSLTNPAVSIPSMLASNPIETLVADLPKQNTPRPFDRRQMPSEYVLRNNAQRRAIAQQLGASEETEEAVGRALRWLALMQKPDGSWNAAESGAGRQVRTVESTRYSGIGKSADSGITALALLSMLGAGHTHVQGEYSETVRKGLMYLVSNQMPNGDLSGSKQSGDDPAMVFSRMYSHGIATLALGEVYAMTGDPSLVEPLKRAANYTLFAQDLQGGGWRYKPGEAGDLSQFGWQAMALRSVEHGGMQIPTTSKQAMEKFLKSVSAGPRGGLACYRPGEAPTATMTAEGLASRLLLELPLSLEAEQEARNQIMAYLPGQGEDNVYYWYYATLAMYQYQDGNWENWNKALQKRLLALQESDRSPYAGSWPPDSQWGGYGGRVYSTAMGALCLEVYYRYLPLYQRSKLAQAPGDELHR